MSKNLNNTLTKEENKDDKENKEFMENILSENSFLLKDSKSRCCRCRICTRIPLFLCFFMIASFFLIILLGSFLTIGILLMKSLYKEINDLYFTNFVIDPIINKKTNSTQAFNIKNEVLDTIYLESKLTNLQIATEFIQDNFETHKLTTLNDFNCIRTDKENQNICKDEDVDDSNKKFEENYFLYTNDTKIEDEKIKKFFLSLTHYLRLFEKNLEFDDIFGKNFMNIKEYFLYFQKEKEENDEGDGNDNKDEKNFNILLTYCNNWNTENGLIEFIFHSSNFKSIINTINAKILAEKEEDESNKFLEFIVNNDFTDVKINQLNYLKVKAFNTTYNEIKYNALVGIRLDSDSIDNLFNKQGSNMTTIAPISHITSSNSDINQDSHIHLLFNSKYFYDFFEYGLKNVISEVPTMTTNEEHAQKLEFENTNITTFFNLLNYVLRNEEGTSYLYNEIWKEDLITSIKLIMNIIGKEYLPDRIFCDEEDEFYYYNILCELNKEDNNNAKSKILFSDIKNIDNDAVIEDLSKTSDIIHQRLQNIGRNTIYYSLIQDAFTDLEKKKSNTKIFYYNSSVNNMPFNSIEVLNIKTYNNLKEEFIKEMDDIEYIVILIRVGFIVIFFIASLIKIIREVFMTIKRINSIISLKDMLFNKTEVKIDEEKETFDLLNNEKDNASKLSRFSEKVEGELLEEENMDDSLSDKDEDENKNIYGNTMISEKERNRMREKWSKAHFYENNFLDEGNKLIIQYTYNKLKNIFENMDFFQNEKFAEKLVFLKRRYKLNEHYEDKDDCELSSDIYQAISKISMINMDDIFYNVYYNQSYALNQSFKMFKSILDNSINKQSIPLRNNKYINFGRILRFIYYIKKEKIQKIIEIIYGKDLKYKNKNEDNNKDNNNIDNTNNIFNEMIQATNINSPSNNYISNKSNLFPQGNN